MSSRVAALTLLALSGLLAACGGGAASPSAAPPTAAPPAATAPPPSDAPAEVGEVALAVADSALGQVVVDGAGMTLYMFTADSPGTSACAGACATSWPPLLSATPPTVGDGLDATAVGTIERGDGSRQVTYHDMPLYFFAGDRAPGDTAGQGVGDRWYVLAPDGTVVK